MLHNAIRVGSKIYHEKENRAHYYDDFFNTTDISFPQEPIRMDEVRKLRRFLNRWGARYQANPEQLRDALQKIRKDFKLLSDTNILDVRFLKEITKDPIYKIIERIYETVATCGKRRESTGTAKILHMLQPELFVMWDGSIRPAYAAKTSGFSYAFEFLPRMQMVARKAVKELQQEFGLSVQGAVKLLCPCGHTLARVLDEYNYAKYNFGKDKVWRAEFEVFDVADG